MTVPTDTSIVLAAVTTDAMTTEQLVHRTMLTKSRVVAAIQELVDNKLLYRSGVDSYGTKPVPSTNNNKERGNTMATTKKAAAVKKAPAAKKAPAVKKAAAPRGETKHLKVAERDNKTLDLIAAAKDGLNDAEIAKALGVSEGIAYQSIRRLNADGKITSAKGEDGKTRRHAKQ